MSTARVRLSKGRRAVCEGLLDEPAADRLVVSNDLSELTRVADWVHAWARQHDVPPRTVERVDLCSTEAITNIVMHAYTDGGSHQIVLRLDRHDDRLALDIQDDGAAFDPHEIDDAPPALSLEDATIGGHGIQLIRRFSDEWHYSRSEERNQSTLVFRLSPPSYGVPGQRAKD